MAVQLQPVQPGRMGQSVGFFYEPLVYVNTLENGKATPWLATSWAWSNGNKVLTFTIRKGLRSDGVPMAAADVAFTYNLLKANPALDLNSIWSVLKSVSQSGDNVVLTFDKPAVPYFFYGRTRSTSCPSTSGHRSKTPLLTTTPRRWAPALTR